MKRLEGKACIVTGAAGSIGEAIARRFSEEGARVCVTDRFGDSLARHTAPTGTEGWLYVTAELSQEESVRALIDKTVQAFGRLDVLVNNAGSWARDGRAESVELDAWNETLDNTLKSVFLCSKHAIPRLRSAGGGSIINIASVNAVLGIALTAYTAAKGGVLALTRVMAAQYGREGIRINAISPGTIRTESWEAVVAQNPNILREWEERYLLHRVGKPEEIAALAAYLASDEATNTTGANFMADGGLSAGLEIPGY